MQRVVWARGVFSPFLFLLILNLLLSGCEAGLFLGKMNAAEDRLSYGRTIGDDLDDLPAIVPPSVAARHKMALAIDSIMQGDYNYKDISEGLTDIRQDPYLPRYLKVEAGYILVLVEKMERSRRGRDIMSEKYKQCAKDSELLLGELKQIKDEQKLSEQESTQLKSELEQLRYKLKKIEEIHIEVEKRRGMQ